MIRRKSRKVCEIVGTKKAVLIYYVLESMLGRTQKENPMEKSDLSWYKRYYKFGLFMGTEQIVDIFHSMCDAKIFKSDLHFRK
jgi:hypothetical protein